MEPLSRDEITKVFGDAIQPLVVEFRAAHDAHEKDIDRLNKQSSEHYNNFRELEDKLSKQVEKCQIGNTASQERSGLRVGNTEIEMAKINLRIGELEKDLLEMKDTKKFNITTWLAVAGFVIFLIFEALPYLRG